MTLSKARLSWIDLLRGIAIIAVVIDHTVRGPYTHFFQMRVSFSVALFVFLAGITSAMTLSHNNFWQFYKKRFFSILIPYVLATIILCLFNHKPIIHSLLFFDAEGPLYFIAFFLQLLLIAPFLNRLPFIFLPLIYFFSFYQNTRIIFPLWGGGAVLFGGSFLFLFYLGMLFFRYLRLFNPKPINTLLPALVLIYIEVFKIWPQVWHNPPYIWTMIYSLSIFWFFFNIKINYQNWLARLISFLGRYSLYIFLYHPLLSHLFIQP